MNKIKPQLYYYVEKQTKIRSVEVLKIWSHGREFSEHDVKQIKAPGRPCYYFHPGMNHLSQMVRAEQGVTWADHRRIPTRVIYRAGTRPPKSENTISQNHGSCAFPEPLRETRDPTFAHSAAVRVPWEATTTRKRWDEGQTGTWGQRL